MVDVIMMRFIKILLSSLLIIIILLVGYFTLFFDLNDFKKPIEEQAYKMTGRELQINGNIHWSIYPNIGITLNQVTLANPKGFEQKDFISVDHVGVNLAFLPLLSRDIQVNGISIDDVNVNWVQQKNGDNSLTGIDEHQQKGQASKEQKKEAQNNKTENANTTASTKASTNDLAQLSIATLSIKNIHINNYQAEDLTSQLTLKELTVNQFKLGHNSPFSFVINSEVNKNTLNANGHGLINLATDFSTLSVSDASIKANAKTPSLSQSIDFSLTFNLNSQLKDKHIKFEINNVEVNDIKGNGEITANYATKVPEINAWLKFGTVDLTPWVKNDSPNDSNKNDSNKKNPNLDDKQAKSDKQDPANSPESSKNDEEKAIDISFLHAINAKLTIDVSALKYQKIHTENLQLNAEIRSGTLSINKLFAQLYDGSISLTGKLSDQHRRAHYQFNPKITGIQIQPLLMDAANMKLISGKAAFSMELKGNNLVPSKVLSNIRGDGDFSIQNGSLYGMNIPEKIKQVKAQFNGEHYQSDGDKKTDFTQLTGSFNITHGILDNNDLLINAPRLKINGKGYANLERQQLNYTLQVNIQDHKSPSKELSIPLTIAGPFDSPYFGVDLNAILKAIAAEELNRAEKHIEKNVQEKLKEKFKDDLLKKLGLF